MTRLSDALDALPLPNECGCACREYCRQMSRCDTECGCYPCPICHPDYFEDDWEPEEFTSAVCRPVTLPSGETIPVLGSEPMSAEGAAALGELIEAARAKHAAEHPENPSATALYLRCEAVRNDRVMFWSEAAREAGVRFSVMTRLANGRMPGPEDLALIEAWLETSTRGAGSAPEPTVGAGGSDGRS